MPRPRLLELHTGPAVDWLFLDLNAYFASVEQQERPELRGRPVGVVSLMTPNTVCIACSYEARPFGVKTLVKVKDAQRLCPQIELVVARPEVYVRYHEAILAAVETVLPVAVVMSIDEAACRLVGRERFLPNAMALAGAVKQALRSVGETLRCSIGLAPNRYLAKVASDMHKPDGLTTLLREDLPQSLAALALRDLPGIGARTEARLQARGLATMPQLLALSRTGLGTAWGGIEGERLWDRLRGVDFDEPETATKTLGRQHVLAPEHRTRAGAFPVAQKLLHRAATELRQRDWWAGGLGVAVNFLGDGQASGFWGAKPGWKNAMRFEPARDAFTLQSRLAKLWETCPDRPPILVSVRLFDLSRADERPPSLFDDAPAPAERATAAMDALNRKFGSQTVYPGSLHAMREAAPPRIAFRKVPKTDQDW